MIKKTINLDYQTVDLFVALFNSNNVDFSNEIVFNLMKPVIEQGLTKITQREEKFEITSRGMIKYKSDHYLDFEFDTVFDFLNWIDKNRDLARLLQNTELEETE